MTAQAEAQGLHTVIVVGFPRCGTTLLMTMLAAAGYPVVGTPPDFEVLDVDLAAVRGAAVKSLQPLDVELPAAAVLLRLQRNPREQAKSQMKMLGAVGLVTDRTDRKRFERDLRQSELRLSRALLGRPVTQLRFERLLASPAESALRICEAVGLPPVRAQAMVDVVIPRPAACRPNLQIEHLLMQRALEMGAHVLPDEPGEQP